MFRLKGILGLVEGVKEGEMLHSEGVYLSRKVGRMGKAMEWEG